MNTHTSELQITPDTKVGALLDFYPQLEQTLIEMAPTFKKLKNPILRKTIGKVATLRQVAQIGEISLSDVINTLRKVVGQENHPEIEAEENAATSAPNWFNPNNITKTLDARPILDAGEHPLDAVFRELKTMEAKQIFELITPFIPVPMIERANKQGYATWVKKERDDLFYTYFILN